MAAVLHPFRVHVGPSRFKQADWVDLYGDVSKEISADMPEPLGHSVEMIAWVDSDHAGNLATRQSQTSYLIFLNQDLILWYSKCQNTVESSTFGSEFIAACTCLEVFEGL
eukprot:10713600-Ditylum_brightwellii.AAC.1